MDEKNFSNCIRVISADAVEKANSGHPGLPMGMADVVYILYSKHLKHNPKDAKWFDRDRFVLSAGHGSMLLYSILYLTGYPDVTIDQIKNFRQIHSKTAGHPEFGELLATETTTGPLGQGISNAVGMAISEKKLNSIFGNDLINHYTYTLVGDGCLMEGISNESASLAGHLKLNKLIVLFDDNSISIDGNTSLARSEDTLKKFEAMGWNTLSCDGHNLIEIDKSLTLAKKSIDKPTIIAFKTRIGKGAPTKENSEKSHGSPLGSEEIEGLRKNLNWNYKPFEIPTNLLEEWRKIGSKDEILYNKWISNFENSNLKIKFLDLINNKWLNNIDDILLNFKIKFKTIDTKTATRKSSLDFLNFIDEHENNLIGGSADLTSSNLTKTNNQKGITPNNFSGNYIYYGVRENAMAAIMNGISLHKGFKPYGGTFLVFTDYARPSIRLSAIMKQPVIYVMTHDSIGVGEDGPTHQPVEHLSSLRCIPNLDVYRPADAIETAECWTLALKNKTTPSILALSRQNLTQLRKEIDNSTNLSEKGGYEIKKNENILKVRIFATGSEVELAIEVAKILENNKIGVSVYSVPNLIKFKNNPIYKNLIKEKVIKIGIEAGVSMSWEGLLGDDGLFFGVNNFGVSAPGNEVYKYFKLTKEDISEKIISNLNNKIY